MPDIINFADAQQAYGFLVPQVYRIEQEVYQLKYPSFDYASLVPVNTDGDMWDIGVVFYSGDIAGQAEFMSGKGFDMPLADVSTTQHTHAFELVGIGYEWSRQELERASKTGRNLTTDKAAAARKVAEQKSYSVALSGSTEKNWTGLINNTSVPAASATTGTWGTATADLILADINEALTDVYTNTGETEVADTLLLPTTAFLELSAKRVGDTMQTILGYIRENNAYTAISGQPLTIRGLRDLETAGATSTRRMVAYARNPDVVRFHLPGPHEFLSPFQKSSMTWEVGGIMNIGGTEVRLPKGMSYRDGL